MAYNAGASSGNLVLIQSQTVVNVASVLFTTGITGYNEYVLIGQGITVANNDVNLGINFSTNGGSSYDTTAIYNNTGYISTTSLPLTQQGSAGTTAGLLISTGGSGVSAASNNFRADIYNLGSASLYKTYQSNFAGFTATYGYSCGQISCSYGSVTAVNAFKILASTGNILTGTFKIYGMQI